MYDIPMHTAETTIFEQLYVNHQPNSITENDGLPFLKELIRVSINLQLPFCCGPALYPNSDVLNN